MIKTEQQFINEVSMGHDIRKDKKNEFQRNEIIQLGREKIDWERGGKLTQIKNKKEKERLKEEVKKGKKKEGK